MRLAAFISSHGFGHAARAAAVMEEAFLQDPSLEFHIFTAAPEWLFRDSLSGPYTLYPAEVDAGPAQLDAFDIDVGETVARFSSYVDSLPARGTVFARRVRELGAGGILADISPLGLLAGAEADVPTALLESFTWSQVLYTLAVGSSEGEGTAERLNRLSRDLSRFEDLAHLRIRAEPAVRGDAVPAVARAHRPTVTVPPVARGIRVAPETTRTAIGVPEGVPLILLTLGGVGGKLPPASLLEGRRDVFFVAPEGTEWGFGSNVLRLPTRSGYFHPDLVAASDAVVGKLGYSTLAEAHQGRTRYGYLPRAGFAETEVLADWLERRGTGIPLRGEIGRDDPWSEFLDSLDSLLALPAPPRADQTEPGRRKGARALLDLVGGSLFNAGSSKRLQ